MVNFEDFIKRLEIILDFYSLSASGFADKIGVQRSSLSHLLSGRNKPSLDFILKIIEVFPEVDLYWILIGKGNFPKLTETLENNFVKKIVTPSPDLDNKILGNLFSENENTINKTEELKIENNPIENIQNNLSITKNIKIEKIIIFYIDGTFSDYNPK
jgi:transcriptional regulator with XRE-family HTH domain